MSQIKLLHSGGNGVSIVAPDSNPASDRTLKLPSDGDGTILTSNSSVGKIVAYESFVWTAHASVGAVSSRPEISSSLRFTYTPTSATNKIIIRYTLRASNINAAVTMFFLGKDVSNYSNLADSEYVNSPAASSGGSGAGTDDGNSVMYGSGNTSGLMQQITLMGIETAGNTNQRIYSAHCKNTSGGTTHFNRWHTAGYYGTSFGELFEVAA
tara:strand:+ start:21175 stop:21807 length:633 start_codon:yes stop_codon:yes gene_type:complete